MTVTISPGPPRMATEANRKHLRALLPCSMSDDAAQVFIVFCEATTEWLQAWRAEALPAGQRAEKLERVAAAADALSAALADLYGPPAHGGDAHDVAELREMARVSAHEAAGLRRVASRQDKPLQWLLHRYVRMIAAFYRDITGALPASSESTGGWFLDFVKALAADHGIKIGKHIVRAVLCELRSNPRG